MRVPTTALLSLFALACTEDARPRVEAETHWMQLCVDDSECGELSCICGVCTAPCEGNTCPLEVSPACAPSTCSEQLVCFQACSVDAECTALDPGLACVAGECRPRLAMTDGAPSDMGSVDADPFIGEDGEVGVPQDASRPDGSADAELDAGPDADPGELCDGVFCEECYLCEAGECVVDQAQLQIDEPVCGSLCIDWPSRCAAITVAHQPLRPGPCFDDSIRALCEGSAGRWEAGVCAPFGCEGQREDCANECLFACDCGQFAVWDDALGCVGTPACDPAPCDGEMACAGAWMMGDACLDPSGLPLDEVCCAAIECGEPGAWRSPMDGQCIEAELGCGVPFGAPECTLGDPPCEIGVFLTFGGDERGGACFGPGARDIDRLSVIPEIRALNGPVLVSYVSACPDGQVRLNGLPDGYDYYGTCADGICEETGELRMRNIEEPWRQRRALARGGAACNVPLPPGDYRLGGSFTPVSDQIVCDFAQLDLRVLGEPGNDRCGNPRSECSDDADCENGRCGAIPEAQDAPCYCIEDAPEAVTNGCPDGEENECCADEDCDGPSRCIAGGNDPQNNYCHGVPPPPFNGCISPTCENDADCGDGVCVPAGAFGYVVNRCVQADCKTDSDCVAREGGTCRPYLHRCRNLGFACAYEDDECRDNEDCLELQNGLCIPAVDRQSTLCEAFQDLP